jgi:hypothetical protein
MQYRIMRKYVSSTHVHNVLYVVTTLKILILLLLLLLLRKIGLESSVFHIRNLKLEPENYVCVFNLHVLHRASIVSKHFLLFQIMHTIIKS